MRRGCGMEEVINLSMKTQVFILFEGKKEHYT